jgi:hypothetical protein
LVKDGLQSMPRLKDLTGQRFTRLTVKNRAEDAGKPAWLCQCDCGNQCKVIGESLHSDNTRSCGCLRREAACESRLRRKPPLDDLSGTGIGLWMVIERAGCRPNGEVLWRCECACGNEGIVRRSELTGLRSTSCGCERGQKRKQRHA